MTSEACSVAIAQFCAYLETGAQESRNQFLANVDALITSGVSLRPDAMTQGLVASQSARAYLVTGDERYAGISRAALRVFRLPVERGGVRSRERHGGTFYETCESRHVLSGMLSALISLWDVASILGDHDAHALFADGIATLTGPVLDSYDLGYATLYDQSEERCATSLGLTDVHARQLAAIAQLCGRSHLATRAARWRNYATSWTCQLRTKVDCLRTRMRKRNPIDFALEPVLQRANAPRSSAPVDRRVRLDA
jgi:hypothetical protein